MTPKSFINRFVPFSLLIIVLLLLLATPALAKDDPRDNPLVIIKNGMLDYFTPTKLVLINRTSFLRSTFTLAPEVRYTRDRQDILQRKIFVGSIIDVFLLDGQVVEIELIQESS